MTTRSKTRTLSESFVFVFDDILEQPSDGNLWLCCYTVGVRSLPDLLLLTAENMQSWSGTYYSPIDLLAVTLKFGILDIQKILYLQTYVSHDDPDVKLWNTITKNVYLEWFSGEQAHRVRMSLGQTENVSIPQRTQNLTAMPDRLIRLLLQLVTSSVPLN